MFNPANLANEVFGILRSFDYVVNIFDFDGNRVYEPEEARRFFASPKNITVSIHEDGENSSIKMFLSKSIDISEVSGLISTMHATASKFGVLFNVRKYERELKPKDLAPNGASDFDAGVSLSTAEHPSGSEADHKSAEIEFADNKHTHSPEGDKLDRVATEVSTLTQDFKEIVGLLHNKKVKESMDTENDALNEAEGQTVNLGILGVDVEADAWENFKKGYLKFDALPDLDITDEDADRFAASYASTHDGVSIDHKTAVRALEMSRVIDAIKKPTPLLASAFQKALAMFCTGSAPKVIDAVINKAINARGYGDDDTGNFHAVPDHDGKTPEKRDMVSIKEFRGQVERQAWQDFVNDHIDFSASVDFGSIKLGATANKLAVYLHLVAEKTAAAGLGNLFSQFATDIDEGRSSPFKVKVAKHAIEIAQHGKVEVGESVIMTESIKAFADWFDSLSSVSLFEGSYYGDDSMYDDKHDKSYDRAWKDAKEEFSADEFLDTVGKQDFGWGDETFTDEDKTVEYDYVKSSLVGYLKDQLDFHLQSDYPENDDAAKLADDFMPDVIDKMAAAGWTVEVKADEPVEEAEVEATGKTCECIEECGCDAAEGATDAGDELSSEDVLLPSRADDDFAREVTADHDGDEMDRIIALARGPNAAWSPRTPQP